MTAFGSGEVSSSTTNLDRSMVRTNFMVPRSSKNRSTTIPWRTHRIFRIRFHVTRLRAIVQVTNSAKRSVAADDSAVAKAEEDIF